MAVMQLEREITSVGSAEFPGFSSKGYTVTMAPDVEAKGADVLSLAKSLLSH